jgi:radical SAM enzyme (TIGR01210 family)
MCDLWQYTTDARVPLGAIPAQIAHGLPFLKDCRHVKLYNAGSFFDAQAVPPADLEPIAELLAGFERVVVECHPALVGPRCLAFAQRLTGRLEVALGLETVHPGILARLNKRMTLEQFRRAADRIKSAGLGLRVFVLSTLPFLTPQENHRWACASVEYAWDCGADIVTVIPTRTGNGAMDWLASQGYFRPPTLATLERIHSWALSRARGIVLVDLWDADGLAACRVCGPARLRRLQSMNLTQQLQPPISCSCCDNDDPTAEC